MTTQRCFLHEAREAVGRCPDCARFFCRECFTDHDGRILCAACIRARAAAFQSGGKSRRRRLTLFRNALAAVSAFMIAWITFYAAGTILASLVGGLAH